MTSEEEKSKPSSNGLLVFFFGFFFQLAFSVSHSILLSPSPLSSQLSTLPGATGSIWKCKLQHFILSSLPSCGRHSALEEEKSRMKKRKSWQTSENKGAPLVPVTCQHYSIRYLSPPTKETLADRLIYATTHICKTKIKLGSPRISYGITVTNVLWYWTLSALNWIEIVPHMHTLPLNLPKSHI